MRVCCLSDAQNRRVTKIKSSSVRVPGPRELAVCFSSGPPVSLPELPEGGVAGALQGARARLGDVAPRRGRAARAKVSSGHCRCAVHKQDGTPGPHHRGRFCPGQAHNPEHRAASAEGPAPGFTEDVTQRRRGRPGEWGRRRTAAGAAALRVVRRAREVDLVRRTGRGRAAETAQS